MRSPLGRRITGCWTDSHELLACSLFHQGVFDEALEHAERGLAAYDGQYFNPAMAAYGDNAGAMCHSWASLSLWFLGFPDLARDRAREAVALAHDPRRRYGYATVLAQAAIVEQCRLDIAATRANAQAAMEVATRDGYRYRVAMAMILHGWAVAADGSHEDGIAELERGLELSRETGAHMDDPYYLALLGDACARAGRIDSAWAAVEAGLVRRRPAASSSSRASCTDSRGSSSYGSARAVRPRTVCARRSNWRAATARPRSSCAQH